jgi:DNA-binding LacI/PurR family transcriptional regulator
MHKTAPKSAPRIGIVTTWIESAYWTTVISGIVDVLRAKGALALCFTWGVPEPNEDSAPDALHPFYELCSSESVSGVILLAPAAFPQSAAAFCERRRPLPLVAVGQKVMQVPSVWVHNAAGTRKMIDHSRHRGQRRG